MRWRRRERRPYTHRPCLRADARFKNELPSVLIKREFVLYRGFEVERAN